MTAIHEQRCATVAAAIYYLGHDRVSWPEITAVIRVALAALDSGKSAATAYAIGATTLSTIAQYNINSEAR